MVGNNQMINKFIFVSSRAFHYLCHMKKIILFVIFSWLLLGSAFLTSCQENFSDDPSLQLSFSVDTIRFDTVFTTMGSATAQVRVRNLNKKALYLDYIRLAGGSASYFRLNIDGVSNADHQVTGVELPAKDSLFIFVEVTIDPQNQTVPILVEDEIIFAFNGNKQSVRLEVYGQDMEVLRDRTFTQDTTLMGTLPYLVYGDLVVDTGVTLALNAGCRFYYHRDARLVVAGHLHANGSLDEPIVMRGNRMDDIFVNISYDFVDGQWGGVWLINESGEHVMRHLEMNSGVDGLVIVGSLQSQPSLLLENSKIHNFSRYGLAAENAHVTAVNTEISNCAAYCVYLAGGQHRFIHNTIANYFSRTTIAIHSAKRQDQPSVCLNDVDKTAPMSTSFYNCIIAGTRSNELGLFTPFEQQYNGEFACNIIQADSLHLSQFSHIRYVTMDDYLGVNSDSTLFKQISYEGEAYYDFTLDSLSLARDKADGQVAEQYPLDRLGNNRMADGKPDLGAYEYVHSSEQ